MRKVHYSGQVKITITGYEPNDSSRWQWRGKVEVPGRDPWHFQELALPMGRGNSDSYESRCNVAREALQWYGTWFDDDGDVHTDDYASDALLMYANWRTTDNETIYILRK